MLCFFAMDVICGSSFDDFPLSDVMYMRSKVLIKASVRSFCVSWVFDPLKAKMVRSPVSDGIMIDVPVGCSFDMLAFLVSTFSSCNFWKMISACWSFPILNIDDVGKPSREKEVAAFVAPPPV